VSAIRKNINRLIEDIDELRLLVLSGENQENIELRNLLRRMFYQLEDIQRQPVISPVRYQKVASLLASLFDAEHGALLKGPPEMPLSEDESEALDEYISNKRITLQAAQQDMPAVYQMILHCSDLLGREPAKEPDVSIKCKRLEVHLREHLQDDASLRRELNQLTSAFENSLDFLTEILKEVGGDAPELQQAKEILKQDLPEDPKKAYELLQNARQNLLQAGDKINAATTTLKENMQAQMSQLQSLSRRLEDAEGQARSDPLTGLANRRKLTEFLSDHCESSGSFIALDIDHFKSVNDTHGHDVGDEILTLLAELLTESVRENDIVARLGGEEFCVVLPGKGVDDAYHVAEKLRETIAIHPFATSQGKINATISLGVAQKREGEAHASWIKRADQALYQSKSSGRNRVTIIQ
jgi:diguanylate cyclase